MAYLPTVPKIKLEKNIVNVSESILQEENNESQNEC